MKPSITLAQLIARLPKAHTEADPARLAATIATGISHDSRQVQPGDVFVCLRGQAFDGHRVCAGSPGKRRGGGRRAARRVGRGQCRSACRCPRDFRKGYAQSPGPARLRPVWRSFPRHDPDRRDRHERQNHHDPHDRLHSPRGGPESGDYRHPGRGTGWRRTAKRTYHAGSRPVARHCWPKCANWGRRPS